MARHGPYPADRRVVAAVSGGADSMALAVLLARWGRPLATVVDHGLRAASAGEAATTASCLQSLGIPVRVLRAELQPGPAAAERAREARFALLLAACREAGCADLLLAHHAADQAETARMRGDAGSGLAGIAGMAAVAWRHDARIVRPLLTVSPARLRATLAEAGVGWVEDPTNDDPRTARGRLRAGMDRQSYAAALEAADRGGEARAGRERAIAGELAGVCMAPEGFALVPGELSPSALSALIWAVSGGSYPPPRAALAAGLAPRTVAGVLLRPAGRLGPGTLVTREPGVVAAPVPALPGQRWDRRFRLGAAPPGLAIGALGDDAARFRRRSALPSVVLRALPALRRDGQIHAVPHLHFPDAETCRSVPVWFCPARPAAGAPFVNPRVGQGM